MIRIDAMAAAFLSLPCTFLSLGRRPHPYSRAFTFSLHIYLPVMILTRQTQPTLAQLLLGEAQLERKEIRADPDRPVAHVQPGKGWVNDPNASAFFMEAFLKNFYEGS